MNKRAVDSRDAETDWWLPVGEGLEWLGEISERDKEAQNSSHYMN